MLKKASVTGLLATIGMSLPALAQEAQRWETNLPRGVTPISETIFGLHMLVFWICVAIGVVTFGALVYTLIAHRKSTGRKASQFHESIAMELSWTLAPFLILIVIAYYGTYAVIDVYDTQDNVDLEVKVTGYQWRWQYEYLGTGVSFISNLHADSNEARQLNSGIDPSTVPNYLLDVDNALVLPINKKVRFLITANDVLHAWWVPKLAVKRDAIPGFMNESWATITEPGIYRGQCAELCGKDHGFMPIVVKAVEQAEFDTWMAEKQAQAVKQRELANQTFEFADLYSQGEQVYTTYCAVCHAPDGSGNPALKAPALRGSAIAQGAIQRHIEVVLKGVPDTGMTAFGGVLSEVDIAAVVTYERNAWGNDMGDTAQPIDVLQMKQ